MSSYNTNNFLNIISCSDRKCNPKPIYSSSSMTFLINIMPAFHVWRN